MRLSLFAAMLFLAAPLTACSHSSPSPPTPSAPREPPAFTTTVSGSGQMVVFIPDLTAPGAMWDSTLAHLGGRVEAHVVEVAGFAGNPPTSAPLMPKLRDGIVRYLRERHAKKPILVGLMFGAAIAYWIAMTEPDLVGGVVAIDAPPSFGKGAPEQEAEEERDRILSADPQKYPTMVRRRLGKCMNDSARADWLAEKAGRSSSAAHAEAFFDMATRDLRPLVASIRAPVLLFRTTENIPADFRTEAEREYREALAPIPKHEMLIVNGSRHYVMFDAPDVFFANLDRFLAANTFRGR
ncbi:alpha/beta hydrolase [Pendulispora rubella]|uniref:Alpha/beta hydrolase n=1 Tax=Pendulispora rubella TaxID=2741070 RepID=A0ABZ2L7C9_9BACT